MSRGRVMECIGYGIDDQWRKECCKLNMQLGINRCDRVCILIADAMEREAAFDNVVDMFIWLNNEPALG